MWGHVHRERAASAASGAHEESDVLRSPQLLLDVLAMPCTLHLQESCLGEVPAQSRGQRKLCMLW